MILEAFQGAIVRNADGILMMAIGFFGLSGGVAFLIVGNMIFRRRSGYQPSSSGERPDPPHTGSGVMPPVDQSARIARLRAELEHLIYAAQGGNADRGNVEMLRHISAGSPQIYGEPAGMEFSQSLLDRASMIEGALKNARDTLEATRRSRIDPTRKPSGVL